MSHALGAVKFPDGRVYFFEYDGTECVALNRLYETEREVEDNWRSHRSGACRCRPGRAAWVEIEIMTLYGAGFHWSGTGCANCRKIVLGTDPYAKGVVTHDGHPDWSPWRGTRLTRGQGARPLPEHSRPRRHTERRLP
jgi:hypothetical protein